MRIWHTRISRRIPKPTNTNLEYVTVIAFPLQLWLDQRTSMLRYSYFACLLSLSLSLCLSPSHVACHITKNFTIHASSYHLLKFLYIRIIWSEFPNRIFTLACYKSCTLDLVVDNCCFRLLFHYWLVSCLFTHHQSKGLNTAREILSETGTKIDGGA